MKFEEWLANQGYDSLFEEGIKVNYKHFESMKLVMKQYLEALENFHHMMVSALRMKHPNRAAALEEYYRTLVLAEKKNIMATYRWLDQKIAELMQKNSMEKQWAPQSTGYTYGPRR